jgi:hypothetical protein
VLICHPSQQQAFSTGSCAAYCCRTCAGSSCFCVQCGTVGAVALAILGAMHDDWVCILFSTNPVRFTLGRGARGSCCWCMLAAGSVAGVLNGFGVATFGDTWWGLRTMCCVHAVSRLGFSGQVSWCTMLLGSGPAGPAAMQGRELLQGETPVSW